MKIIRQSIEYEGHNHHQLQRDLQAWHRQHPFQSGLDWGMQTMWATMTDEDCLAFLLKYPQYIGRFQDVKTKS